MNATMAILELTLIRKRLVSEIETRWLRLMGQYADGSIKLKQD